MNRKRFEFSEVSNVVEPIKHSCTCRTRFEFGKVSNGLEPVKPSRSKGLSRLAALAGKPSEKPFLRNGELVIPVAAPDRYRWWSGGQSIIDTLLELGAPDDLIRSHVDPILTHKSWARWQKAGGVD